MKISRSILVGIGFLGLICSTGANSFPREREIIRWYDENGQQVGYYNLGCNGRHTRTGIETEIYTIEFLPCSPFPVEVPIG